MRLYNIYYSGKLLANELPWGWRVFQVSLSVSVFSKSPHSITLDEFHARWGNIHQKSIKHVTWRSLLKLMILSSLSMLISCIKVIKGANNMMISHDDYFHCSFILSLLTVLSLLYCFSLHSLIMPAIILSEERSHFLMLISQLEIIMLLIFAWCSALLGEEMTNLISSLICCHEFTTHHFLMMDA